MALPKDFGQSPLFFPGLSNFIADDIFYLCLSKIF